ncbi:RNA polymerase sigma-70 factor [Draconibacterium sp.]|nr:RNA polymerase sigma-70 factor [Draconibacterium sp.]
MINDQKSISLIASGNQETFKHLMEQFADDLFFFAKSFIRNSEVAEEIVSDVFVKIWKNRTELNRIKNLKSYLFICVKNGCLSHLRKTRNEKVVFIDEFTNFQFLPVEGPETDLINKEAINKIYQAIEILPPKCKVAFTLAKINGLRHKEIAEVMGVSEKTVNNHIVSAIKKITSALHIKKKSVKKKSPLKQASLF